MAAALFDLVLHDRSWYTVCGIPAEGRLRLIDRSWPVEFAEIEDFKAPEPFEVDAASIKAIKERGPNRLLAVARMLVEAEANAEAKGSLDWNDVNAALEAAAKVLPSNLLLIDHSGRGSWRLADEVPDDMLTLANPAAMTIATHAVRMGEADIADIEEAMRWANRAVEEANAAKAKAEAPAPVRPVAEGRLMLLKTGERDETENIGLYRAKADLDLDALTKRFAAEFDDTSEHAFAKWLVGQGLCEQLPVHEVDLYAKRGKDAKAVFKVYVGLAGDEADPEPSAPKP